MKRFSVLVGVGVTGLRESDVGGISCGRSVGGAPVRWSETVCLALSGSPGLLDLSSSASDCLGSGSDRFRAVRSSVQTDLVPASWPELAKDCAEVLAGRGGGPRP